MIKLTKTQNTIITALVVILIVLAIYYYGRNRGKNAASEGNQSVLPDKTDWGKSLSEVESAEIQRLAYAMYQDMKGVNVMPRDMAIYTAYLSSSERIFVGTANYFYDNYGTGENLAQWIEKESFFMTNAGTGKTIAEQILERLNKFGIKA